jgi:hypothetical protein
MSIQSQRAHMHDRHGSHWIHQTYGRSQLRPKESRGHWSPPNYFHQIRLLWLEFVGWVDLMEQHGCVQLCDAPDQVTISAQS